VSASAGVAAAAAGALRAGAERLRGADERAPLVVAGRLAAAGRLAEVLERLVFADEEDLAAGFLAVDERFVVDERFADAGFLGCGITPG
jgi:hypothetical protein